MVKGIAKEGKDTSEYAGKQKASWIAIVVTIIGAISMFAPNITGAAAGTPAEKYVAGALVIVGLVVAGMVELGYMKARTDVKRSIALADASKVKK